MWSTEWHNLPYPDLNKLLDAHLSCQRKITHRNAPSKIHWEQNWSRSVQVWEAYLRGRKKEDSRPRSQPTCYPSWVSYVVAKVTRPRTNKASSTWQGCSRSRFGSRSSVRDLGFPDPFTVFAVLALVVCRCWCRCCRRFVRRRRRRRRIRLLLFL